MKIYASSRPAPKFEDFEGTDLWIRVRNIRDNQEYYMKVLSMNMPISWYQGSMRYLLLAAVVVDSGVVGYWDAHGLNNWEFMMNNPGNEACSSEPSDWEICNPLEMLTTDEVDELVHNLPYTHGV